MARTNTDWAVLAVIAFVKSGRRHDMTVGSLKEAGAHEALTTGHSICLSAVELGIIHLELNGLIEVGFNEIDDLSPVALSDKWTTVWEEIFAVEQSLVSENTPDQRGPPALASSIHTAQIKRLEELVKLSPFPTEHQVSVLANSLQEMTRLKQEEIVTWKEAARCLQKMLEITKSENEGGPVTSDEYLLLEDGVRELKMTAASLHAQCAAMDQELTAVKDALIPQRLVIGLE